MRFPGFIGPTYSVQSKNVDCQRCINWYPQVNETGHGKDQEVACLLPTPGLTTLVTLPYDPVRGVYTASNGVLYAVGGNKVYVIEVTLGVWGYTELGTLTTSSGPVSMSDSGRYLAIVDGSTSGYFLKFSDNTYSAIPFPTDINFVTFQGCDIVDFQDGYFIYKHKNTGDWFISGHINEDDDETTINATDFTTSEGNPDDIVSIISANRDVWVFNDKTAEVFFNSGAAGFPFDRVQGGFIEHGCAATFSVASITNDIYWLGKNDKGAGVVYKARGYTPEKISTFAIDYAIQSYSDISDAIAFTYQQDGHDFYALNFPAADTTWVYDATTGLWHERTFTNNGQQERHRANNHAYAYDTHVVGDYDTGKLYKLDNNVYSDDGAAITRKRTAPHLTGNMKRITYHSFELDIETGVGLDGTGQGTDPQVMLRFSDDHGHSWSNEKWTSFGKIGRRLVRPIWRRLGMSRDRVFEISITDPVKAVLIGAEFDAEVGSS
jgi:hypothetical protein